MLDRMRYTYRCGVCRTLSTHPSRTAAEAERAEHADVAHHGRQPENESIIGPLSAPRPVENPVRAWLIRHDRIVTRAAMQLVALFVAAGLLYQLATNLG